MQTNKLLTIPNFLTLIRLLLTPFILIAVMNNNIKLIIILMTIAALSELDGTAARKLNQVTSFGNNFDTTVDMIFLLGILIGLSLRGLLLYETATLISLGVIRIVGCLIRSKKEGKFSVHSKGIDKAGGVSLGIALFLFLIGLPAYIIWLSIAINAIVAFRILTRALANNNL